MFKLHFNAIDQLRQDWLTWPEMVGFAFSSPSLSPPWSQFLICSENAMAFTFYFYTVKLYIYLYLSWSPTYESWLILSFVLFPKLQRQTDRQTVCRLTPPYAPNFPCFYSFIFYFNFFFSSLNCLVSSALNFFSTCKWNWWTKTKDIEGPHKSPAKAFTNFLLHNTPNKVYYNQTNRLCISNCFFHGLQSEEMERPAWVRRRTTTNTFCKTTKTSP